MILSKGERFLFDPINQIAYNQNSFKDCNESKDTENCVAYSLLILQFSVWITATECATNHAVIHNIEEVERLRIRMAELRGKRMYE